LLFDLGQIISNYVILFPHFQVLVAKVVKYEWNPSVNKSWLQVAELRCAETAADAKDGKRIVEVYGDLGRVVRDLVLEDDYLVIWGGAESVKSETNNKQKVIVLNNEDATESSFVAVYRHNVSGLTLYFT